MNDRNKTAFFSLLFLGVLVALYFTVIKPRSVALAPSPTPSLYVTNFLISDISDYSWKYSTVSAQVKQVDTKWKIISPAGLVADSDKIGVLINSVLKLPATQKLSTKDLSLESVGLKNPSMTFSVSKKDGNSTTFDVGSSTLDSEFYYVRQNNDEVIYLVSATIIDDLKKDPYTLTYIATPAPLASPTP